jgi:hypothetical protein
MTKVSLGELVAVDLREVWIDEARDFTPWLALPENMAALSKAVNELELEVEGVEVRVGSFKADIVAVDTLSNSKVIIENQLEKTNHDHLGKIITYASGLGASVIIWIAREFSEEHRQALDFLNEKAAPNIRIYGIEMKLMRIGNSPPAPDFRVIARPNDYVAVLNTEKRGLTETKALYLEFWNAFKDYCQKNKTTLSLRKPQPQLWYSLAVGRSKFWIGLTASTMHGRIGCEIYIRGVNAKKAFKLLQKDKSAIEQLTGPLEWQELEEGRDCRIVHYRQNVNIADRAVWDDAHKWLKAKAELFHKVFSQRIKSLPITDEEEDEQD